MNEVFSDTAKVREYNKKQVYDFIRKTPGITQAELREISGLSRPTILKVLQEMTDSGLIVQQKNQVNTGGRIPMGFFCNKTSGYAVGFQISDHHITAVILNAADEIVLTHRERISDKVGGSLRRRLGVIYKGMLKDAAIDEKKVIGIGIAVHALTDPAGRKMIYLPSVDSMFSDLNQVGDLTSSKVRLFHDLDALAYNKKIWSWPNMFYLSISDRVGGVMMINGRMYAGDRGRAGEIGHMCIVPDGKKCYCGNKGCFDAYCSTAVLKKTLDGTLQEFFEAVDENHNLRELKRKYVEYLAGAVFSIHQFFDGIIVIGGELGTCRKYFYEELCDNLDKRAVFPDDHAREYLKTYDSGVTAFAEGAAAYFTNMVLD